MTRETGAGRWVAPGPPLSSSAPSSGSPTVSPIAVSPQVESDVTFHPPEVTSEAQLTVALSTMLPRSVTWPHIELGPMLSVTVTWRSVVDPEE